jgi:hypothetical protein
MRLFCVLLADSPNAVGRRNCGSSRSSSSPERFACIVALMINMEYLACLGQVSRPFPLEDLDKIVDRFGLDSVGEFIDIIDRPWILLQATRIFMINLSEKVRRNMFKLSLHY